MFLVCFCVVASTAAIGVVAFTQIRDITMGNAIAKIAAETRDMAHHFDKAYSTIARDLRTVAGTAAVSGIIRSTHNAGTDPADGSTTSLWRERLAATFRSVLDNNPEYTRLRFVELGEKTREILRVERSQRGTVTAPDRSVRPDVAERYIRFGASLPSNEVAFSDILPEGASGGDTRSGMLTVHGMTPVDDVTGQRFGLIVIDADYEAVLRAVIGPHSDENYAVAVNGEGGYVQRSPGEPIDRVTLQLRSDPSRRPPPLVSRILGRTDREGVVEIGDTIAYFVRDSGRFAQQSAQIGFATQLPTADLFADAVAVRNRVLAISLVAALVLGVIAIIFARRFIQPLGELTGMISSLPDRKLIAALPTDRGDEIGDLARSFRQRTQALIDSEARAKVIVHNVADGLILLDELGTIEEFNPSCERIFAYRAEEIIGQNVTRLLPQPISHYERLFRDVYRKLKTPGQAGQVRELEVIAADGRLIPVEIGVCALVVNGRMKFSGVIRDISERREVERIRSEFVATVSHELRTPLTSIRGALALTEQFMAKPVPEKIARMLSMAQKNTSRLILLVNDILDFEKLQASKMQFRMGRCDLAGEIAKAVELNAGLAQERKVSLKSAVADEPLACQIDQDRFQQVMANLISNAVKFSPENDRVEVTLERQDGAAVISVVDHGPGIPQDFRDKIFMPFSQADASSSAHRTGTGLGLIITKRLVEGMGGEIGFVSEPGEGTTFRVAFPLAHRRDHRSPQTGPRPVPTYSGLHLEEDADFAEILRIALEDDIELTNETTVEDARQRLSERTFDLVIIDTDLRSGNAGDLFDALPDPAETAIVVLTALDAPAEELPFIDLTLVKSKQHIGDVAAQIRALVAQKQGRRRRTAS
ncbi:ATP-binding protein [Breoghania sp. JC706]|uniref:ATP-binding protein n=1 Tax=Breoghania sp. JC706 TaxID=3117732 RepID=UPI00300AA8C4